MSGVVKVSLPLVRVWSGNFIDFRAQLEARGGQKEKRDMQFLCRMLCNFIVTYLR